jgi:hypothetical protein
MNCKNIYQNISRICKCGDFTDKNLEEIFYHGSITISVSGKGGKKKKQLSLHTGNIIYTLI